MYQVFPTPRFQKESKKNNQDLSWLSARYFKINRVTFIVT